MEDNKRKEELYNEFLFLNSKESKKFTVDFLQELGSELDNMFPGITYVMSLRFKSEISAKAKIDRISQRTDPETKNIYDNIGLKIVVTHVSNSVQHANCQLAIEKRDESNNKKQEKESYKNNIFSKLNGLLVEKADTLLDSIKSNSEDYKFYSVMINKTNELEGKLKKEKIENIIAELEKYIENNKVKTELSTEQQEIKKLKETIIKTYEKLLKEISDNIEHETEKYNTQDRECSNLFSQYMLEQIKNNSKVLKRRNIFSIPGRYKRHTGSKHYYVASHNSFKTSKKAELQGWKIEIQVTSDYYNQDATLGKAKHSEKEGKARNLINHIARSKEEYKKNIEPVVPETYVYISGSGKARKCSRYESYYLYYQEVITGQEHLKELEAALKAFYPEDYYLIPYMQKCISDGQNRDEILKNAMQKFNLTDEELFEILKNGLKSDLIEKDYTK